MINLIKPFINIYLDGIDEAYLRGAFGKCDTDFQYEVGGVGRITTSKDGVIILGKPVILKQIVTETECEFTHQINEWVKTWASKEMCQEMPSLDYYLFHSHASMEPFWSRTDDKWIENYATAGLLVSLVGNHDGKWKARVDTITQKGDMHIEQEIKCKLHVIHQPREEYLDAAREAAIERDKMVTVEPMVHVFPVTHDGYTTPQFIHGVGSHQTPLQIAARNSLAFDDVELDGSFGSYGDTADIPPFSTGLPHGTTVSKLITRHGIALKVYFAKPNLLSFIGNKGTMYTVTPNAKFYKQLCKAFRINKDTLSKLIASGQCIRYNNAKQGPKFLFIKNKVEGTNVHPS